MSATMARAYKPPTGGAPNSGTSGRPGADPVTVPGVSVLPVAPPTAPGWQVDTTGTIDWLSTSNGVEGSYQFVTEHQLGGNVRYLTTTVNYIITLVASIVLEQVAAGDEASIVRLLQLLSIRGWCFVDIPSNLQKISKATLEGAEKFFQLDAEQKSKFKLATNFGYVEHKTKQAYRALTGPLLQELNLPEQLKSCVSALAFKLDQLCRQMLDSIGKPFFGYNLTSDPLNNNITLKVAAKYSGYGMLDIVEYYNNDDNDLLDKKTLVGSHGDPGLFSISLGSTNPGLSMLDIPTKQWIPVPIDKCVLWCGSEARSMSYNSDNNELPKLQVGLHRVERSENGLRRTIWYEVCSKYQIPEAIRFYGMNAKPPVVDQQTDPIVRVNMKCLMGDVVLLELRGSDVVYKMKQLMQDKKGFPPEKQRLLYQPKGVLVDEKTLNDYGIKDGDTVYQILALRSH